MARKSTIAISEIIINNRLLYRLTYPTAGCRKREHFASKKDAKGRMADILAEAKAFGERADGMSAQLRADAIAAAAILSGTGWTIVEAARSLREQIDYANSGRGIREAVAEFLELKKGTCSRRYLQTLAPRLNHFANAFDAATTATLTPSAINSFISGLPVSNQTRAHYRTHIAVFANHCRSEGYSIRETLAADLKAINVPTGEAGVLTAKQAEAILSACSREILPGVVLGLFCGLRQAEIERIEWSAISFEESTIVISALIAKTNSRRVTPIAENAMAFLASYEGSVGRVWPKTARNQWNLARIAAGFGPFTSTSQIVREAQSGIEWQPWPENALRHTAISVKVATDKDLARISYESGNSPTTIKKHYLSLMKESEAAKFFALRPGKPLEALRLAAA